MELSRSDHGSASWPERIVRFIRWLAESEPLPAEPAPERRRSRGRLLELLRGGVLPSSPVGRPRAREGTGGVAWLLASERLPVAPADGPARRRSQGFLAWLLARETLPPDSEALKGEGHGNGK